MTLQRWKNPPLPPIAPIRVEFAMFVFAKFLRVAPLIATGLAALGSLPTSAAKESQIALGREVYIAEGCIHCHSQYIRPNTSDVERWGPAKPLDKILVEQPPLLGNRRQGPDLTNVGNRRSPDWNRLHLIAPRSISPGSRMPAYDHLFRENDPRGEALVSYLASLGADTLPERLAFIQTWQPAADAALRDTRAQKKLFTQLCASCHGPNGRGDGPVASQLGVRPPDFARDDWRHARTDDLDQSLARIVKFGLPGSPMAGHEYLNDSEVVSLAAYVHALHDARSAMVP